jgi:hypothetical protein
MTAMPAEQLPAAALWVQMKLLALWHPAAAGSAGLQKTFWMC